MRTVRIPSEEASPFIKLTRLRTLIDAGRGGGFGVAGIGDDKADIEIVRISSKPLEEALLRQVHRKGAGASLSNLTQAMRINRPSLYVAFGNKEQLFGKVLDRYMDGPVAYFGKALAAPRARDVVEEIFRECRMHLRVSAGLRRCIAKCSG